MNIKVNPSICVGCRICELACSFTRQKYFSPAEACIQVLFNDDGSLTIEIGSGCRTCETPLCIRFCPVGAISVSEPGQNEG